MKLSDKVHVLIQIYQHTQDDTDWRAFWESESFTFDLALASSIGYCTLKGEGIVTVEQLWNTVCQSYNVDPDKTYASLLDVWAEAGVEG